MQRRRLRRLRNPVADTHTGTERVRRWKCLRRLLHRRLSGRQCRRGKVPGGYLQRSDDCTGLLSDPARWPLSVRSQLPTVADSDAGAV